MTVEPASDELIAEIERGLEGVTPGPWKPTPAYFPGHIHVISDASDFFILCDMKHKQNARHIARCHPGNIAALIARIRQQEERIKVMDEASRGVLASLVAAVSLLKRGGKKAAPSDKMFDQMIADYEAAIRAARAARKEPTDGR